MKQIIFFIIIFLCSQLAVAENINTIIDNKGTADEVIHHRNGTTSYVYLKKYRSPQYAAPSTQPQAIIVNKQAIGIPLPPQEISASILILCATTYLVDSAGDVISVKKEGDQCD